VIQQLHLAELQNQFDLDSQIAVSKKKLVFDGGSRYLEPCWQQSKRESLLKQWCNVKVVVGARFGFSFFCRERSVLIRLSSYFGIGMLVRFPPKNE
jgi:hypothetical protein|tara:strand:- start:570 stop:857 length:288 start_codon:yes stop_codon:yes gene_type:complete